jgi:hypothetical protein
MRLSDLAQFLSGPTWLIADDIYVQTALAGYIPVEFNHKDTIFVILVLPDPGEDRESVYLRVTGKVELPQVRGLLRTNKTSSQARSAKIVEIGLCEDPDKPCEHKGGYDKHWNLLTP